VKFIPCADETELLTQFWDVAKNYDSVVTFNGRGFDVPFIYLRSALLNVPISKRTGSATVTPPSRTATSRSSSPFTA
jgi:uncharacterized protein YprB with RNaseH-like and TPR domain